MYANAEMYRTVSITRSFEFTISTSEWSRIRDFVVWLVAIETNATRCTPIRRFDDRSKRASYDETRAAHRLT